MKNKSAIQPETIPKEKTALIPQTGEWRNKSWLTLHKCQIGLSAELCLTFELK